MPNCEKLIHFSLGIRRQVKRQNPDDKIQGNARGQPSMGLDPSGHPDGDHGQRGQQRREVRRLQRLPRSHQGRPLQELHRLAEEGLQSLRQADRQKCPALPLPVSKPGEMT